MPTWLTYDEIAERRRISRLSAHKLVRRNKWERRPMGDGSPLVQVLVPSDKIVREQSLPRAFCSMVRSKDNIQTRGLPSMVMPCALRLAGNPTVCWNQ